MNRIPKTCPRCEAPRKDFTESVATFKKNSAVLEKKRVLGWACGSIWRRKKSGEKFIKHSAGCLMRTPTASKEGTT